MRLLLSLAFLQLSIFSLGQTPAIPRLIDADSLLEARTREALGKPFPTFAANEQGKINKDSLKGKVVLINFWFEGRHPCLAEFSALNELVEKLKGNKGFEFISLINN